MEWKDVPGMGKVCPGRFGKEGKGADVDIQKAGIWIRISAWLFDKILLAIAAVGVAALLSLAFDYDGHLNRYHEIRGQVEETYCITLDITE